MAVSSDIQTKPYVLVSPEPKRGLNLKQAADYIGIGETLFSELVKDGKMPKARVIKKRLVYDIKELDAYFDALPYKERENPWDAACQG